MSYVPRHRLALPAGPESAARDPHPDVEHKVGEYVGCPACMPVNYARKHARHRGTPVARGFGLDNPLSVLGGSTT